MKFIIYLLIATSLFSTTHAFAAERGYLLAQNSGEEIYDPFADYNEYEEASDEEADINFFRNGRFFTLALYGGMRNFTGVMGEIYKSGPAYGGYLAFFFDLRFALQVAYITGEHPFQLVSDTYSYKGNITVATTNFSLKYYFNTQNVTRGLSGFNPYIIGGLSQAYRTTKISGLDTNARDSTSGLHGGLGFEVPMMRNKMYIGLEAMFYMLQFPDANEEIKIGGQSTGIYPKGYPIHALGVMGINF